MQPVTNTQGIHPYEPASEIESCFDSNVFFLGIAAWQDASPGLQLQFNEFELPKDEYMRLSESMKGKHCKPELQKACASAIFTMTGQQRWITQHLSKQDISNLYLTLASYAKSKMFGAHASYGDVMTYFFQHPEFDREESKELVHKWQSGEYVPLLSFFFDRMNEAVEAYQRALRKYGNYAFERVDYFENEHAFIPMSEILDTDYFILHALIELVEPKLGRC